MIVGTLLLLFVGMLNGPLHRRLPEKARVFVPSVGWYLIHLELARGPFVWFACSLAVQGMFATLLFITLGFKSDLVTRSIIFPFMVSAMTLTTKDLLPPIGVWPTVGLVMLQAWTVLGGLVMLGCFPGIVMQVLEQQEFRSRRFKAAARNLVRKKDKVVDVLMAASLDGRLKLQTLTVKQSYETSRWVIYCGGNAEFLENTLNDIHVIADALKAHAVLYNPRGIGFSTGSITALQDIVEDAAAVAKAYIEKEKIEERNLLFFGHSIGGGSAAAMVAQYYPQASLVVDRSFSSMSDAAVGFSYLTPNVTRKLFPYLVGDLHITEAWDKVKHNRKLVLYAKQDEIIKYDICSFARLPQFHGEGADAEKVIELTGTPPSYHNSLLDAYDNFEEVCTRMNKLFVDKKD